MLTANIIGNTLKEDTHRENHVSVIKHAAFAANFGFHMKCYGLIQLNIPQNNMLCNCPLLIWICIEVCFCLTFGVIVRDHCVMLCMIAEHKFVHNEI